MNTVYSVSAAADLLSVSVSTIRRVCADMPDILPDYQPAPGQTRTLSDADVRTISAILTRLQASPGLTRSGLLRELSTGQGEPLIVPTELPVRQPQTAQDSPGKEISVQAISDSPTQSHTALQSLSALAENVAQLSARLDAMPAQTDQPTGQERPERVISAVLVALGVIFSTVLLSALVWPMAGLVGLVIVAAVLVWGIAPLRR